MLIIDYLMKSYLETIIFENWTEKSFLKANDEPESTINLAQLYWQG